MEKTNGFLYASLLIFLLSLFLFYRHGAPGYVLSYILLMIHCCIFAE